MTGWNERSPEVSEGDVVLVLSNLTNLGDTSELVSPGVAGGVGTVAGTDFTYSASIPVNLRFIAEAGVPSSQWVGDYVLIARAGHNLSDEQLKARGKRMRKLIEAGVPKRYTLNALPYMERIPTETARWVSRDNPLVDIGDQVKDRYDHRYSVFGTEPNDYDGDMPVYGYNHRNEIVQWIPAGRYTPIQESETKYLDRAPIPGDTVEVLTVLGHSSDEYKEAVVGKQVKYVRRATEGYHLVVPPDGQVWPEALSRLSGDSRSERAVMTVRVVDTPTTPETTPETPAAPPTGDQWTSKFERLKEELEGQAAERDWCSEYEEAMKNMFDIDAERDSIEFSVDVGLKSSIDAENYISADEVFGSGAEGSLHTTDYTTVSTTVMVYVRGSRSEGPSRDAVEERLDDEGFSYDEFTIEDYEEC